MKLGRDFNWGASRPQNNHLLGVWKPGSFIDQRERSNEEPKSKGRIKREMKWGGKAKGSFLSLAKHLQGKGKLSEGVCNFFNLFYSQVAETNYISMS